jgi:hypothetical protein
VHAYAASGCSRPKRAAGILTFALLIRPCKALLAVLAGNTAAEFRATKQHKPIAALGRSSASHSNAGNMAGSRLAGFAVPLLLSMLLLLILGAHAAVRADSSAEVAPSGVPDLDLAKWNQAYKVTVANVTEDELKR